MRLDEVLALDKEQKSIKKIDLFLSEQSQTSYEYIKALSYKCLILHSLDHDKDALKHLLTTTPLIDRLDNRSVVELCDALINIFIDIKNNDQALKYIDIKKEHLPAIDSEEYLYDMIRFYNMCGNRAELKRTIVKYLSEDIPDDKRGEVLELLLKFQYIDKEYEGFDNTYKKLEGYYISNFEFEKLSDMKIKRSYNLFQTNNMAELEVFVNSYIKDDASTLDLKITGAKYLLEIYLDQGKKRNAMILEAEYHDKYLEASLEVQLDFVESAKRVAEVLNNRFLIDEYEERTSELEVMINEARKASRKERKKNVVINVVEEDVVEHEVKETLVIKKERRERYEESPTMMIEPTLIEISSNYKSLEEVLSTLATREGIKFREILRNFGMEIEKRFAPCEIVIASKDRADGYHYKMERVYEKMFDDEALSGSANGELLEGSSRLYLLDVSNSLYDKNPITKMIYDSSKFKTLIGFSMMRNERKIASIVYVFNTNDFKDKLIYETLRMLTSMLTLQYNRSIDVYDEDKVTRAKNFIYEHQSNGVKTEFDHTIEFNERAREILGIKYKSMDSQSFIAKIDARDVKGYRDLYDAIYNREADEGSVYYHINGRYICEEVMTERVSGTKIYSVITDKTYDEKKISDLRDKISYDDHTHLKTKYILFNDIARELPNKKFAVAIVSVLNYKMFKEIYGYDFALDLTKLLGMELAKLEVENINIYHLEDDLYVFLFKGINDLRSVKSHMKRCLDKLKGRLEDFNRRLKIELKCGIFRYTKSMRILDIKKILANASDGLIDAYEADDDICVFDPENYGERFREGQVLLHVSEAIDDRSILVNYKQVVNISSSEIPYYMARLNMSQFDIDEEYFDTVISKREITGQMDKYLIKECLNEIKTFHDQTKVYYKLIIPIHRSTIADRMFIAYLDRFLRFYKIPDGIITFDIIDDTKKSISNARMHLIGKGIRFATRSIDLALTSDVNTYICDIRKYKGIVAQALKKSLDMLSVEVLTAGVSKQSEIDELKGLGISLVVDEVDLLTIGSIIKNYNKD